MSTFEPAYLALLRSGELKQRVQDAYERLHACDFCGRECRVDRYEKPGTCHTGVRALVSSFGPHFGEEDPLRGYRGSGTIFFAWCNLNCQFCQNYDISQLGHGREVEPEELAEMMLSLQAQGCHNINLVSPTHVVAPILAAVLIAAEAGLRLPLVWNTGGYDSLAALALLDGVVDIYMPDMKYADAEIAQKYSKIKDYPAVNQAAVREMHRQVGDLVLDENGIALRGLLVRHLVLPEGLAGTAEIARFLAGEVSRDTYINIMDQYRPCYKAAQLPPLDRPITRAEWERAVREAREAGLHRFDKREPRFFRILWGV
ncbi:MAG: radical SAM protein [Chloroflexi bacterium]|nr:MAG: radical SAM protein [Chloroflexota bacterium]RLC83095.1 MAG: radical SAM protein [Chloroflexota bacterium]HEY68244.1 radical SAM protein [Thermoflexia bacterium]